MRVRMLAAVAGGLLVVTATAAQASAVEKDDVAVAVPVEPVSETVIRDEAMMVIVGSALIGAAAAVRRAA